MLSSLDVFLTAVFALLESSETVLVSSIFTLSTVSFVSITIRSSSWDGICVPSTDAAVVVSGAFLGLASSFVTFSCCGGSVGLPINKSAGGRSTDLTILIPSLASLALRLVASLATFTVGKFASRYPNRSLSSSLLTLRLDSHT